MNAVDQWLAENTIACRPYHARISPAACVANQAGSALTCCPCEDAATGVEPLAKPVKRTRKGRRKQQAAWGQSPYMSSFTGAAPKGPEDDPEPLPPAAKKTAPRKTAKPRPSGRRRTRQPSSPRIDLCEGCGQRKPIKAWGECHDCLDRQQQEVRK